MNLTNIQTFLSVAQHHSLSEAAASLYISQPTATARIQQLEAELGVTLLHRQKGVRTTELTPQGNAFLPIALRWVELEEETAQLSSGQNCLSKLTIACPDSLSNYLFQPLYENLAKPEQQMFLRVRTHQSPEIFSLMENREAQIGFAFHLSRSSDIRCVPLFREKMILLFSGQSAPDEDTVHPDELDVRREIYLSWSQDIQIWHNSWFGSTVQPHMQTDCAAMVGAFLRKGDFWVLCPESVAASFEEDGLPVARRNLSVQVPDRTCYLLTHQNALVSASAACESFLNALRSYLETVPYLTVC